MEQKETVLITGSNGEIGHGLIPTLYSLKKYEIVGLDISDIDGNLGPYIKDFFKGTVLDKNLLFSIFAKYKFSSIFHLAAILSTQAEKEPRKAQIVNSGGTANLLEIANTFAQKEKRVIKFIFPSTIAVYGLPDLEIKNKTNPINEESFLKPITIYGITKLYSENLGIYYSKYYQLLNNDKKLLYLDFRCLRFPGIISALTIPLGGTSDYAPEMIHSLVQGKGYESFVRPDTIIPFMVMPDAVKALIQISETSKEKLRKSVYNVTAFSATAEKIAELVNKVFPDSAISYKPDIARQKIVDSWPARIDDSAARKDWGWQPEYDIERAFSEYLIPEIQNKYNDAK